jgi:hypothetical protein
MNKLRLTAIGMVLAGSVGAQAPTLVSPSNGADNIALTTPVTWSSAPNTQYELHAEIAYSTHPLIFNFDTVTSLDTCVIEFLDYSTNVSWQVRYIKANDTSGWSATWSFTTVSEVVVRAVPTEYNAGLGYSGAVAVYNLEGRQIKGLPFAASATKQAVLKSVALSKDAYIYRFLRGQQVMDRGKMVW